MLTVLFSPTILIGFSWRYAVAMPAFPAGIFHSGATSSAVDAPAAFAERLHLDSFKLGTNGYGVGPVIPQPVAGHFPSNGRSFHPPVFDSHSVMNLPDAKVFSAERPSSGNQLFIWDNLIRQTPNDRLYEPLSANTERFWRDVAKDYENIPKEDREKMLQLLESNAQRISLPDFSSRLAHFEWSLSRSTSPKEIWWSSNDIAEWKANKLNWEKLLYAGDGILNGKLKGLSSLHAKEPEFGLSTKEIEALKTIMIKVGGK